MPKATTAKPPTEITLANWQHVNEKTQLVWRFVCECYNEEGEGPTQRMIQKATRTHSELTQTCVAVLDAMSYIRRGKRTGTIVWVDLGKGSSAITNTVFRMARQNSGSE